MDSHEDNTLGQPRSQGGTKEQGTPIPLAHSAKFGENVDWKPAPIGTKVSIFF